MPFQTDQPFQLTAALAAFWAPEDRNKLVNGALWLILLGVIAEMLLKENTQYLLEQSEDNSPLKKLRMTLTQIRT